MSSSSSIEWTDATWNPVRGCTKVSAGCKNCYAETFAERWRGVPGHAYEQGFDLRLAPAQLALPLRWRAPKRIFVNSMSDLFHEDVPDDYIAKVFGVMAATPRHTYQILTKRADRLPRWFAWIADQGQEMLAAVGVDPGKDSPISAAVAGLAGEKVCGGPLSPDEWRTAMHAPWPLPNVWLGVSAEDQEAAEKRVLHLLETPAAVRFVSAEPLLGPVDLTKLRDDELGAHWNALEAGIGWVIVGGESGPGARPFDLAWARAIVQQCRAAGVPVFVKQLGADPIDGAGGCEVWQRDRKGGDPAEWPEELRVREFPR